jgi:hypothetical protein
MTHYQTVCRSMGLGDTLTPMPGVQLADVKARFLQWRETTVTGKVFVHAAGSVAMAAIYRGTFELLHLLLPKDSPWSQAIESIEGFTVTTIFVMLSLEILSVVWKRMRRSRNDQSFLLANLAL